jgi:putative PIN family toxin of toxin-antitoxin system
MVAFAIRGDITCFASVETLRELFVVFSREHIALRLRPAPNILQNYLRVLIIVLPITYTTGVLPDSSDEKFLDAAIAANADFIISGDSRLLELKQFCGIRIVSAKEFLASTHK